MSISPVPSGGGIDVDMAVSRLTDSGRGFQKWLGSKASTALFESWNQQLLASLSDRANYDACVRRHFLSYKPPADLEGWLLGVGVLAETLPICFVVSDAQTAGFPMVYINSKFTDVTGYTKVDCSGRNCRFMQGPATNPEHGQMLVDTLRRGEDSQIMMVNYRKSGEPFENLLTMAYVGDSLGRRRFCVGFQLDLTGLQGDSGPWGRRALGSDNGREMIIEIRKKMRMLIKMLPKSIPVPAPASGAASGPVITGPWSCPQLDTIATAILGAGGAGSYVRATDWAGGLKMLLDHAPHAAVLVDMTEAGLPLAYVNNGFCALTGWAANEVVGHNCRFLQSSATEPQAMSSMIVSIRECRPFRVQITNARKDGSTFVNDLSLHPVYDTTGVCRYSIGLLIEHAQGGGGGGSSSLEALRASMPSGAVDASLMPDPRAKFAPVEPLSQWHEFQTATAKLMRLLWSTDADGAIRRLLMLPPAMAQQGVASLREFLEKTSRTEDSALLEQILHACSTGGWSPLTGRVDG
jgi:PAS domain S-box-containing protein